MTLRLWLLGDGERDAAMLPPILEQALGEPVEVANERPAERSWHGLTLAGGGYARKLAFAARQALDARADGLVAVVDQDRAEPRARLRELERGREQARARVATPVAIGEARPHGEAWLLDDAVAVRLALELPPAAAIPTVRDGQAKPALDELIDASPRAGERPVDLLAEIARALDPGRCAHAKETGLADFVDDVRRELSPRRPR